MAVDERLVCDRFPRASGYHPDWVLAGVSGGANPLWLTEWLAEAQGISLVPTEYKLTVAFVILVIVLLVRPTGIFKGLST